MALAADAPSTIVIDHVRYVSNSRGETVVEIKPGEVRFINEVCGLVHTNFFYTQHRCSWTATVSAEKGGLVQLPGGSELDPHKALDYARVICAITLALIVIALCSCPIQAFWVLMIAVLCTLYSLIAYTPFAVLGFSAALVFALFALISILLSTVRYKKKWFRIWSGLFAAALVMTTVYGT